MKMYTLITGNEQRPLISLLGVYYNLSIISPRVNVIVQGRYFTDLLISTYCSVSRPIIHSPIFNYGASLFLSYIGPRYRLTFINSVLVVELVIT